MSNCSIFFFMNELLKKLKKINSSYHQRKFRMDLQYAKDCLISDEIGEKPDPMLYIYIYIYIYI